MKGKGEEMERLRVTRLSCFMSNSWALQSNAVHFLLQQNFHNRVNDLSNSMYRWQGAGERSNCCMYVNHQSMYWILYTEGNSRWIYAGDWRAARYCTSSLLYKTVHARNKRTKNKKWEENSPPRRIRKLRDIQRRLGQALGPTRWRLERASQMEPRQASGKVAATEPSSASWKGKHQTKTMQK